MLPAVSGLATDHPNILWLTTEDNSVHYVRLYDKDGAPMPNVERLADHGIVFQNAFSNAPVCSAARSTIISGCYAPRVMAQFHRRLVKVPLPDGLHMFPWYLRQAGYYTSNNNKEDYNFNKGDGVWDDSSGKASYRGRSPGQPFFHVQNFNTTHEGRLQFSREQIGNELTVTDPKTVPVFPIHPDTPLFRYTNAKYRDLHRQVDREIGEFLNQLEADGLMEDTIIFYYGDHGGVLPGSKGYVYERGLHVPMVVSVPDKWLHLAPAAMGSRVEGFVEFADLAPTVLNLAGLEVPVEMDGRPFLGNGILLDELNQRDTAFSHADRFDEKYDLVRALRKGKFKYIRSYQPFNVDALQNNYRYRMLAYQEWRNLHREGKLNPVQSQFFEARSPEALYDLDSDPFETRNLAAGPEYQDVLSGMRKALRDRITGMPDLGFIPEPVLLEEAADNPVEYGQRQKDRIGQLVAIADLQLIPFAEARWRIRQALQSDDPLQRYWAWIACSRFGREAEEFAGMAGEASVSDPDNLVRTRAAEFLGLTGLADPRPLLIDCLKGSSSPSQATLILNTITLLHDLDNGYRFTVERDWLPESYMQFDGKATGVVRRFEYLETD